jgi:hypothetical protein
MRPKQIIMDLDDADPNGVFVDQQLGAAGNFTLNGAGVSGGVWTSPDGFAKQIGLESSGDLDEVTFTVTGFADLARNIPLVEALVGADNGTVETAGYFAVITQIAASAAVGTNIEAGPVDEAVSQIIPLNWRGGNVAINVTVTGTIDYTVQQTFDDVQDIDNHPLDWDDHDDSELVGATATKNGNYVAIPRAMRVKVNSYSSGAALTINVSQSDV